MKLRAFRCLFIIACITMAVAGCGSRSHTSVPIAKTKIAAGMDFSLALKSDGSLWAWGRNENGQLGLGREDWPHKANPTPRQVGTANDWAAVACDFGYSLALKTDGSLWAWGGSTFTPTQVGTGDDWAAITAGLALRTDGSLWALGGNNGVTPTQVGNANDWAAISGGYDHSLALKKDGSLWAWGQNGYGELGLGSADTKAHPTPTQVGTDNDWTAVVAGYDYSLALKTDGSLWAWGWNLHDQAGLGDTTKRTSPTQVGTDSDWTAIAGGWGYNLALKRDGSLWAWGDNANGELGPGYTAHIDSPTRIGSATDWAAITCGAGFSLALKRDGSLWVWGYNKYGQLGLGDTKDRHVPTRATGW